MTTFKFKEYRFILTHDNGKIKIKTVATSLESAIFMICKAENCPESALKEIKP